jgi:allantoinase
MYGLLRVGNWQTVSSRERGRTTLDNPYYRYLATTRRPVNGWPAGQRIALVVLVYLEYWQMDCPPDAVRDARFVGEYGSFDPDYRTWSQREYGNRVGLFRVLDILDRYPLRLTVPINAACVSRHGEAITELKRREAEFVGHGLFANRMVSSRMDQDTERALIRSSLDTVEAGTGSRPVGWVSQDAGESTRTPALLAEAGLRYLLDWPNDDSPYLMRTEPAIVSIPLQPEWDDVQQHWIRRLPMDIYPRVVSEAFQVLAAETDRVFVLSLHPWLIGMAHRARYLDEALRRLFDSVRAEDIWPATAGEVAQAVSPVEGSVPHGRSGS